VTDKKLSEETLVTSFDGSERLDISKSLGGGLWASGAVSLDALRDYAGGPLNNFTATRVPDANDDSGDGYSVGSLWADVAAIAIAPAPLYYCADPAPGAAVWERITPFSTLYNSYMQLYATTRDPNVNDDANSLLFASQVWVNTATPSVWVSLDSTAGAAVWQKIYPTKTVLTGNTTVYARAGGSDSDSRSGLVDDDANAFATVAYALNRAMARYDADSNWTIVVNWDGTNISGQLGIYTSMTPSNSNITIDLNGANVAEGINVFSTTFGYMTINNVGVVGPVTYGDAVYVEGVSLQINNIEIAGSLNDITRGHFHAFGPLSVLGLVGSVKISGGGSACALAERGGHIEHYTTVDFDHNTVAFSHGAIRCITGGSFKVLSGAFSNVENTTGDKFFADQQSTIDLVNFVGTPASLSSIPGDAFGTVKGGSVVAGYLASGADTLNNFAATTDPTVNDDSGYGYSVGSRWINVATSGKPFLCTDATLGAAVWRLDVTGWSLGDSIIDEGGGLLGVDWTLVMRAPQIQLADPTVNDDSSTGSFRGGMWINTATSPKKVFLLADDTPGAAVWLQLALV
jgi:hypothetical protein